MKNKKNKQVINKVESTTDTITGRAGLAFFSRYLDKLDLQYLIEDKFGAIRKSSKGLAVWLIFKQIFCFLFDGTSSHIQFFDHLKKDEGYAATIETDPSDMASSHIVKRFFGAFGWWFSKSFRWVLHRLFIWRLKINKPSVIELFIDTMVMNNDDALKREGVQPTYKKVKGFQPLQIIWNGKIVDAVFRGGSKNSNHGNTVVTMVTSLVKLIRSEYSESVTIILRFDAGFFDEKNFAAFNSLNVGFIGAGKMYEGVKKFTGSTEKQFWNKYENGRQKIWNYIEFGFRCNNWNFYLRAVYTTLCTEGKQLLLDFARPDSVILTNIGVNELVLQYCTPEEKEHWLNPETIIAGYHKNGGDELCHRGFKDFGFEELPFKRFGANSAFYYCMVIAFFLFETFKEDVLEEILPVASYAATVRRTFIDIAGKFAKTGRKIILRINIAVMNTFKIDLVWQRCQRPPPIIV